VKIKNLFIINGFTSHPVGVVRALKRLLDSGLRRNDVKYVLGPGLRRGDGPAPG